CAHDLPHAIRAKIEADRDVAVAHRRDGAIAAHNDRRRHELVGDVALVRRANDSERIGGGRPNAFDGGSIPFLRSVPTLVAIHTVVASANTRDYRSPGGALQQLAHVAEAGSRHRVAAVEESVNSDARGTFMHAQLDQCEQMLIISVYAALADE